MAAYQIEIVTPSVFRPGEGMKLGGVIVRYGLGNYGWMCCKCFDNYCEAQEFARRLK